MKAHELYALNDDGSTTLIYFILDSSRRESSLKRARYMMSASKLTNDERISSELFNLANDLQDVEKAVQSYVSVLRTAYPDNLGGNEALVYALNALEDQPIETKLDLLNALPVAGNLHDRLIREGFHQVDAEVRQYNLRFESFLFKLRTRHYDGLNREASDTEAKEETTARATVSPSPAVPADSIG